MSNRPTISLCMIARDEELLIEGALLSARDYVDEMIVVDTGSTDHTREAAKEAGARLYEFEWVDDFAAARNFSLSKARKDWIFILDADERLLKAGREALYKAVRGMFVTKNILGYTLTIKSEDLDGTDHGQGIGPVRIFRNVPQIRYQGTIHEAPVHTDPHMVGGVIRGGPHLLALGYDPQVYTQKDKDGRNMALLTARLEKDPNDMVAMYYMVKQHSWMDRRPEAMEWAQRMLAHANSKDLPQAFRDSLREVILRGQNWNSIDFAKARPRTVFDIRV